MFLNQLNLSLGSRRRVFSFPTSSCTIEGRGVFKPDGLDFWVDFNLAEVDSGVAFYSMEKEGSEEPWQLEVLLVEDVLYVSLSFPTPKEMVVSISNAASGDVELTFDKIGNNQIVQILRQMFGSQLNEVPRDTRDSRTEASTTPKKQLLISRMENMHPDEAVLSPENTSIPPSEEEDSHLESLPCAQPAQPENLTPIEQIPINSRPHKGSEWKGKSNAQVKKIVRLKKKDKQGINAYSPVVTIGKIQAGKKNEKIVCEESKNCAKKKKETKKEDSNAKVILCSQVLDVDEEEEIKATPEMVGGPAIREDVSMTRSGGRKRAVRKLPEGSRQKIKGQSKPTQLHFYDEIEVPVVEDKESDAEELLEKKKQDSSSEASTSRGSKAARGLKKMLGRVPKALGLGNKRTRRVSVSPSLGNISELSARGFLKRRASSVLGKEKGKRSKTGEEMNGATETSAKMSPRILINNPECISNEAEGDETRARTTNADDVNGKQRPRVFMISFLRLCQN